MSRAAPSFPVTDPDWLAHRYDPARDCIHFVRVERERRAAIPFLTDEYIPDAARPQIVQRAGAVAAIHETGSIHFIFHAAYCCSTLLAAAFDHAPGSSALKEPVILNDMVGWRHRGGPQDRILARLDDSLTLLARPYHPGEAVVVKPSNVVNALAPAMLTMRPDARALLLYAPLPVYLASIARKGLWGRVWVRDLLVKQLADGLIDLGIDPADYLKLTDLQVAGIGWLAQIDLFGRLLQAYPDRVRTLDSEHLLARPAEALSALAALYGIPLSAGAAQAIAEGPIFRRDAKSGAVFTADDRQRDQQRGAALYAEEIDKVTLWIAQVAQGAGVAMQPGGRLI